MKEDLGIKNDKGNVIHDVGDAVEGLGDKIEHGVSPKLGDAVEKLGDKIEHIPDKQDRNAKVVDPVQH